MTHRDGKLHREDGPAIIKRIGDRSIYEADYGPHFA
jgi:hypothetical protein